MGRESLFILGAGSKVYREKSLYLRRMFPSFNIIELTHQELNLIPRGANVVVFAYSSYHKENQRLADYLHENSNKCFYILSASSFSWLSSCFSYSRVKRRQLDYLRNLRGSQNLLAIFGSFSKIKSTGKIAVSTDEMLGEACTAFIRNRWGMKIFFEIRDFGSPSFRRFNALLVYSVFGVILGSAILKISSRYIYGYSDARFYKESYEPQSAVTGFIERFIFSYSLLFPVVLIFLVVFGGKNFFSLFWD